MTDLSAVNGTSARVGTGIKVAALAFTLGAIALAADLARFAPERQAVNDGAHAAAAATPAGEYRGYAAPAGPPAAEAPEHVQAF